MKTSCDFAQGDDYGRIHCTVGSHSPLCKYQRYCSVKSEWQNTEDALRCERRETYMASKNINNKHENPIAIEAVEAVEEIVAKGPEIAHEDSEDIKNIQEKQEKKVSVKEEKKKPKCSGRIILHTKDGCVVESIKNPEQKKRLYGFSYLDKKIGEIVEY